jgi:hypothetical protein
LQFFAFVEKRTASFKTKKIDPVADLGLLLKYSLLDQTPLKPKPARWLNQKNPKE